MLEPADRVGLLVEPGLVDVLLRDVGDRPGALPLLSHALRQTWLNREGDVLTVDGYAATGGIAGAVAQTADAVYAELDADHRRALRSLLLRLVSITPDGAPVGTRLATGPRTEPGLLTVIERLAVNRLVTVEDGAVALSHESLAQAWPRLRTWLDDDVRGRRVLEHLKVAAAGWAATGRPVAELYSGARLAAALEWRQGVAPGAVRRRGGLPRRVPRPRRGRAARRAAGAAGAAASQPPAAGAASATVAALARRRAGRRRAGGVVAA